uniref:Phosphodiesterase n=1 Tax=Meloidogyne incognita TaxID=6306 RepID=A0A914LRA4_MELIC
MSTTTATLPSFPNYSSTSKKASQQKQKSVPEKVSSLSSTSSSTNSSSNTNLQHNDPALYTALFKRKFVKVFTGSWDLRANAEKRWNRRSSRKKQQKGEGENRHNYKGRKQRTSACLINCLECDVPTSKPRVSNITFSTVTSATGLPTIAAEPSRPRSSSYWKALPPNLEENHQHHHYQQSSPQLSPTNTNPFIISPTSTSSFCRHKQLISSSDVPKLKEIKENNQKQSSSSSSSSFSSSEINQTKVAEKPFLFKSTSADNNRGGIEMTGQPKDVIPSTSGTTHKLSNSSSPTTTTKKQPKKASKTSNESLEKLSKDSECQKQPISSRKLKEEKEEGQKIFKTSDGTIYELNELESKCSILGQQLQEWSFPIFNFADKYKNTVLSRLTFAIFKEADLFKTFKISYSKFFNFFHALESGYWDIPYHNQIHAADVLHGCFYLTCHSVHAFYDYHQSLEEVDDEGEEIEELSKYSNNWEEISKRHQHQQQLFNNNNSVESTAIPLSQSMSALELMALYSAAAMHDYDHPGRTNAFLVASEDKKAILYNDRSVLENHHAAESWKLLTSQSSYNFIENLDSAETKRFRYLVLEYILATDLKQHFDIIVQFNERAPSMDLSNESDRMLISLMIIKFADINSPAKPFSLHKQWTERICQEFYEQGDEERLRNMAISPYMDRSEPAVAKLQDSFIAHIVNPLAIALNEANLLPILPGLPESELIINLRHNHQKWLNQIEFDQKFCREGEDGEGNALERNKTNISRYSEPPFNTKQQTNNNNLINNQNNSLIHSSSPSLSSSNKNIQNNEELKNTKNGHNQQLSKEDIISNKTTKNPPSNLVFNKTTKTKLGRPLVICTIHEGCNTPEDV